MKRGNPALSNILVLGTDEDEALSGGILKETSGTTIHLLGKEHVQASVDKKLQSLNFPSLQRKIILSDIFGGSTCKEDSLYGSESAEAYNRKVLQLKSKWLQIEKEQTSNRPSNQFVDYFESYKEKQIRDKMIKGVRKQASIDGVYGQNPIEWQNFLSKDEISAQVHSEGRSHRDATLSECIDSLKSRDLRLYSNVVKALYDDGPYVLSPPYHMFRKSYEDWKSMSPDERKKHISAFMTHIPTDDVLLRARVGNSASKNPGSASKKEVIPTIDLSRDELPCEVQPISMKKSNGQQQSRGMMECHPPTAKQSEEIIENQDALDNPGRTLSVSLEEASVLKDVLPPHFLGDAFDKAVELLNEPNGITKAASDDNRVRTVKSRYGSVRLIVKPFPKNRDLFQCTCKVYKAVGMCCDTIAVADEVVVLCNYLCELRKKLGKRKKAGKVAVNITAAVQSDLSTSLQGHKKNEIKKIARRKKKSTTESIAEELVQRRPTTSSAPISCGVVSILNMPANDSSTRIAPILYSTPPVFQPTNQYVVTSTQSSRRTLLPSPGCGTTATSTLQSCPSNSVTFQLPIQQLASRGETSRQSNISFQQLHGGSNNGINNLEPQGNACSVFDSWNSSMSPYPYELVLLPNSVTKCYGCHHEFTAAYRMPPIVVRHMDRRITGRDQSGRLVFSPDFKATYYHPTKEHIMLKNPVFDGRVYVARVLSQVLSPEHLHVVNNVLNINANFL